MSPIYPKLREAGAVFGQVMGYERPAWFDPGYASGTYRSVAHQESHLNVRFPVNVLLN